MHNYCCKTCSVTTAAGSGSSYDVDKADALQSPKRVHFKIVGTIFSFPLIDQVVLFSLLRSFLLVI